MNNDDIITTIPIGSYFQIYIPDPAAPTSGKVVARRVAISLLSVTTTSGTTSNPTIGGQILTIGGQTLTINSP